METTYLHFGWQAFSPNHVIDMFEINKYCDGSFLLMRPSMIPWLMLERKSSVLCLALNFDWLISTVILQPPVESGIWYSHADGCNFPRFRQLPLNHSKFWEQHSLKTLFDNNFLSIDEALILLSFYIMYYYIIYIIISCNVMQDRLLDINA